MSKERDLLKKIHYCWVCATDLDDEDPEIKALNDVMREAEHYLFHEPVADKPVAWMRTTPNGDQIISFHQVDGFEPLYTRPEPAIRKPMTEEELDALIGKELVDELTARIYKWGFRDAEKHHGIGGDDGQ